MKLDRESVALQFALYRTHNPSDGGRDEDIANAFLDADAFIAAAKAAREASGFPLDDPPDPVAVDRAAFEATTQQTGILTRDFQAFVAKFDTIVVPPDASADIASLRAALQVHAEAIQGLQKLAVSPPAPDPAPEPPETPVAAEQPTEAPDPAPTEPAVPEATAETPPPPVSPAQ